MVLLKQLQKPNPVIRTPRPTPQFKHSVASSLNCISVKGSHHILLLPINWFLIMVMRRLPFGDSELTASMGALGSLGYAVGR